MSSLQKKGNSKYFYAVIDYKDEKGVRRQKWVSTKCTKITEAKRVLKELDYKLQHSPCTLSNIMFTDFMSDWLDNVISKQVQQTTLDGYTMNIKKHIIPYFITKDIKLQELKPLHLQRYFDDKCRTDKNKGEGCISANTLKRHYVNIRKALDYAVKMELIERNPAISVTVPSGERYKAKFLTVEQAQILIDAVRGTNVEAAVYLTINYGLRRGEVLGLRWKDIDFKNNCLLIQNTRTQVSKPIEKKPKTESSVRKLYLIPKVADYLRVLKKRQLENQLFWGNQYEVNDYVCKYDNGAPLKIVTLNHGFKRVLDKSGLPRVRFHDLRHSAASYLYQLGFGPKEIQTWLGHSNITTTMDIYVHLFKEANRNLADGMNELFGGI